MIHPLVPSVPRLVAPLAAAARVAVLRGFAATWRDGAVAFHLPDGTIARVGDGGRPITVRVRDDRAFLRILLRGEMGAGEGLVAGEWDADDLVGLIRAFLRASAARGVESWLTRVARVPDLLRHHRRRNDRAGARRNIAAHYDLGNPLYQLFLDDAMVYSCAIWEPGDDLASAQHRKLDRVCDLAGIAPGDHVLEIGAGWGALAIHAASTRGCRVTAITVSAAQAEHARAAVARAGLADRIRVELRDYRDVTGRHDRVISVEMLEAVGHEQLPGYFRAIAGLLRPGGRAVIQTITMPDERYDAYRRSVDWMQTYVFPGTVIPSLAAIRAAIAGSGLALTSVDDIGASYVPTLRTWRERFAARLPAVRALGFDEPFLRAWRLYLSFSEAAFAERTLGDAQLVCSRP